MTNYDQFVIELEQLARELWPDKFKPRTRIMHGGYPQYLPLKPIINADVAGIRILLAVSDCGEHEYKEIAMNEAKVLKQCQVSERFACLEKGIIQLQGATEILQDRLSAVLRQELPGNKKDENSQKDQLVPLAKRLSKQEDIIRTITSRIESLYGRLEI